MAYEYDYRPHRPFPVPVSSQENEKDAASEKCAIKEESVSSARETLHTDTILGDVSDAVGSENDVAEQQGERVQRYRMENRPGGCDIRPQIPAPIAPADKDAPYGDIQRANHVAQDETRDMPYGERESPLHGLISGLGWVLCAIAILWMFTVSSPFLANTLTLSGWRFWCSIAIGSLPVVFVATLSGYVWIRFRKIPDMEQIDVASCGSKAVLRGKLVNSYFRKFPRSEIYAAANGFSSDGGVHIRGEVARILNTLRKNDVDNISWFREFDYFQELQTERAKAIILKTGVLVGAKTALSPWKVVDMIAVVYNSTVMITKLARLYNRRVSKQAALRLVWRWVVTIYIAGELGDVAQSASEWLTGFFTGALKPFSALLGKLAEGGGNGVFVGRLGIRAIAEFRPLTGEVKQE